MDSSVKCVALHTPALSDVATVLESYMLKNFDDASAKVTSCPNLTRPPFQLAAAGLNGHCAVADIGGVPNLVPQPNFEKRYNLEDAAKIMGLKPAFLIGAGAGPFHIEKTNCEMVANLMLSDDSTSNCTRLVKIDTVDNNIVQKFNGTTEFALMANIFACEGLPGDVIELKAKVRKGDLSFINCLRKALHEAYGSKTVALGGVFVTTQGSVKVHVMPNFSTSPLTSDEEVNQWLTFHDTPAPIVCVGYVVSHDPGYDLRMEHFHGFSPNAEAAQGGHYHYDTTPEEIEYHAILNIAETLYRIDAPVVTHQIGRD